MASGISLQMQYVTGRKPEPLPEGASRDRSIPGKRRRVARKAANRAARSTS